MKNEKFKSILIKGLEDPHEGDMMYYAKEKGVKPVLIKEMGRNISLINDTIALFKIIQLFKKENPDIVDTHTAKAGVLGRLGAIIVNNGLKNMFYSNKNRIKIIHTFHGNVFNGYFSKQKTYIYILIERILGRFTDKIICLSNQQRKEILDYKIGDKDKVISVPLGVDLKNFIDLNRYKGQLRKELGIKSTTLLIGIVARLVPVKNHEMIINVINNLVIEGAFNNTKVLFIGDGELKDHLMELVYEKNLENVILFLGFRKNLGKIYSDLDIVALTSINEGLPISLIEAMASGLPIISTNVGGVSDLLEHKSDKKKEIRNGYYLTKYGMLVNSKDVGGFSLALKQLIELKDLRKNLGTKGQKYVLQNYDISRLVRDMSEIYINIINK